MGKRPFVLTEIEDYALCACDDQILGALVTRDIISQYLKVNISVRDMRRVYERLLGYGLVKPYRGPCNKERPARFKGTRTRDLSFQATRKGVLYLKRPRHVV